MRRRWIVVAGVVLAGAVARADGPATDEACRAACGGAVARCAEVFGPALGDMRPPCERAVLRRCRAMGV